jgi:hypothetical protein
MDAALWWQMADRLAEASDAAKVESVVPEGGGGRAPPSVDKLDAATSSGRCHLHAVNCFDDHCDNTGMGT